MEVKVLGSAAAEGFPALWCECDICRQALANGGKDLRRRTSYLIDDDTIVDFGPDALSQVRDFAIDLLKVKRLLFTHPHADHLSPLELLWRKDKYFSSVSKKIKIFGSERVFGTIMSYIAADCAFTSFDDINIIRCDVFHGTPAMDEDLTITPLNADHAPGKGAFVYLLSRAGKNILIGNDTGWLPAESWTALRDVPLDLVFLDTTMGIRCADLSNGHMGANVVVENTIVQRVPKRYDITVKK